MKSEDAKKDVRQWEYYAMLWTVKHVLSIKTNVTGIERVDILSNIFR